MLHLAGCHENLQTIEILRRPQLRSIDFAGKDSLDFMLLEEFDNRRQFQVVVDDAARQQCREAFSRLLESIRLGLELEMEEAPRLEKVGMIIEISEDEDGDEVFFETRSTFEGGFLIDIKDY